MSQAPDINALFQTAVAAGDMSAAAVQTIMTIPDIGQQIQNGLGVDVEDVHSNDPMQFAWLVDDTGSMSPLVNELIKGYNLGRTSLLNSRNTDGMIVHTAYISGTILHPFQLLTNTPELSRQNYNANFYHTPLRDQMGIVLARSAAKFQEFADAGTYPRSFTVIISDVRDTDSRLTPQDVAIIVNDMRSKIENHIIAFVIVDDGGRGAKDDVLEMGIHPDWILSPKNTESEFRAALQLVSQSAVRASQAAKGSFSQVALGGFK
jgi:hypothetical protein